MSSASEVRAARADELDAIYLMGVDVWDDGADRQAYLRECRSSPKYRLGTWFVLATGAALVSSLIVYEKGFALPENCIGIGSLATAPSHRGLGYARRLLSSVLDSAACRSAAAIYLHSEIEPRLYTSLGFVALGASRPGILCMVRPGQGPTSTSLPKYF